MGRVLYVRSPNVRVKFRLKVNRIPEVLSKVTRVVLFLPHLVYIGHVRDCV